MENRTDVVYPIGKGSSWKNNELRFSLRSLEKYGINVGKLFIVGELPNFLSGEDITHIKADDRFNPQVNADGNIIEKVLAACADSRLSEDFLFINDDHVLLEPVDLMTIPNFHKGDMNTFHDNYWNLNYWRKRLKRTRDILNEKGLPALHYDCHTPILINRKAFVEMISHFDYQQGIGFTMKSLYGNFIGSDHNRLLTKEKKTVFSGLNEANLSFRLLDSEFMAFNDSGLNQALKIWLYQNFEKPSKWEMNDIEDRTIELYQWVTSERNFRKGVQLFEKYLKDANLVRLFKEGETDQLKRKLEYKIIHALDQQWKSIR